MQRRQSTSLSIQKVAENLLSKHKIAPWASKAIVGPPEKHSRRNKAAVLDEFIVRTGPRTNRSKDDSIPVLSVWHLPRNSRSGGDCVLFGGQDKGADRVLNGTETQVPVLLKCLADQRTIHLPVFEKTAFLSAVY